MEETKTNNTVPASSRSKRAKESAGQVLLQTFSLISSAFVLVAALAWNDLVKQAIDYYFKTGNGLISHLFYALIVTLIAVVVTTRLNHLSKKFFPTEN